MNLIRELRKAKGLSQEDLARLLHVTQTAVSHWETGKNMPDAQQSIALAKILGISVDYLLTGEQRKTPTTGGGAIVIPVLGSIPAGVPVEAIEDILDYEELSTKDFDPSHEYFGLKVKGDSMYPKYLEGDVIIVKKQPDCESGQDCVVYVNGYEATLKTVKKGDDGSMTLRPINPEYPPRTYTQEDVEKLPVGVYGIVLELRRAIG